MVYYAILMHCLIVNEWSIGLSSTHLRAWVEKVCDIEIASGVAINRVTDRPLLVVVVCVVMICVYNAVKISTEVLLGIARLLVFKAQVGCQVEN